MSKKLRTDIIADELASSAFFRPQQAPEAEEQDALPADVEPAGVVTPLTRPSGASTRASNRDITPAIDAASTTASSDDSDNDRNRASILDSTVDISHDSDTPSPGAITRESTPAIASARTEASKQARTTARKTDSVPARRQSESLASLLADSDDLVDAIYRIVRRPGKEISYVRLTDREKAELGSVLARIGQEQGYKVSETELIRIAICNLLADYAANGQESLLMRVIVDLKD